MAFDTGFDFRGTLAYVTDPANCFYVSSAMVYPDSSDFGGTTAGWTFDNGTFNDENATNDPRLAGRCYASNGFSSYNEFRVHLPATGSYSIVVAMGDATGSWNNYLQLIDGSSSGTTFQTLTNIQPTANTFNDANGNIFSEASFFASQVPVVHTFTTQDLLVRWGDDGGAGFCSMAHFRVTASVTPPTGVNNLLMLMGAGT